MLLLFKLEVCSVLDVVDIPVLFVVLVEEFLRSVDIVDELFGCIGWVNTFLVFCGNCKVPLSS